MRKMKTLIGLIVLLTATIGISEMGKEIKINNNGRYEAIIKSTKELVFVLDVENHKTGTIWDVVKMDGSVEYVEPYDLQFIMIDKEQTHE